MHGGHVSGLPAPQENLQFLEQVRQHQQDEPRQYQDGRVNFQQGNEKSYYSQQYQEHCYPEGD